MTLVKPKSGEGQDQKESHNEERTPLPVLGARETVCSLFRLLSLHLVVGLWFH